MVVIDIETVEPTGPPVAVIAGMLIGEPATCAGKTKSVFDAGQGSPTFAGKVIT
jgi:hypothetical protein